MATLVIAVGIAADGEYHNLYTGPSFSDAQSAMLEAGRNGQISVGELYSNPMPAAMRQFYTLREDAEAIADNAIKRPRGRPRKYPIVPETSMSILA